LHVRYVSRTLPDVTKSGKLLCVSLQQRADRSVCHVTEVSRRMFHVFPMPQANPQWPFPSRKWRTILWWRYDGYAGQLVTGVTVLAVYAYFCFTVLFTSLWWSLLSVSRGGWLSFINFSVLFIYIMLYYDLILLQVNFNHMPVRT